MRVDGFCIHHSGFFASCRNFYIFLTQFHLFALFVLCVGFVFAGIVVFTSSFTKIVVFGGKGIDFVPWVMK